MVVAEIEKFREKSFFRAYLLGLERNPPNTNTIAKAKEKELRVGR